ncbi:hypothetical protein [Pseudovibrio sp. SPO723]|uniref:hypothetical protein n=1 Tax=Nesiotobacter zosterae TaxID=392721 RepID=UPI0029C45DF3|nr:hypothetical protein [Pseudovibrio sp. SPO723]MDX5592561.1 hypothetical protein [Pseudovibrio sp. SPO723]
MEYAVWGLSFGTVFFGLCVLVLTGAIHKLAQSMSDQAEMRGAFYTEVERQTSMADDGK